MRPWSRLLALSRRWRERRRRKDRRAELADDVRRVAGYAEATVVTARRLKAELPEGVAECTAVWRAWAARLAGDDDA